METFGITGGIATGKSTVTKLVREAGVPVVDLDIVAREVVEPGLPCLAALVQRFGASMLTPEGTLDRKALRAHVFADRAELAALDACIGPFIAKRMWECLVEHEAAGHVLAAVDGALMVEQNMIFRPLLVVTTSSEIQLQRLMARDGFSVEEATWRIAHQMPVAEKARYADIQIDTSCSLEELKLRVGDTLNTVREMIRSKNTT